ncbi:MAG: hypothetical protein ABDI19_01070, partial [Armatimonadota bacterium]
YLRHHPEGECLDFDQFLELVRKGRRARDYYRLMRHISTCLECRRAYLQLRAIEQAQQVGWLARLRQRLAIPHAVWVPAAGAVAVALALVWWLFQPSKQQMAQQPSTATPYADQAMMHPPELKLPTAEPKLAPERPREPRPPVEPSGVPQSPIQRELASLKRVEPFLREAARAFATLPSIPQVRGGQTPSKPPMEWLQPDIERNAAIPDTQPTFEWRPVPNAVGYRLQIRPTESDQQSLSVELNAAQTRFTLPAEQALQPGVEYEIALAALLEGDKRLIVHRKFYVLSKEQLGAFRWAREHAEKTPLLSAMVFYYQLDRYTDALACLEYARQKYPQEKRIAQWLEAIQARIVQRQTEFTAR